MATSSFLNMVLRRRTVLAGAMAQWVALPANASQIERRETDAALYFRDESTLSVHLSPDGQRLAMRSLAKHKGVMLSVWNLADMTPTVLHSQEGADACDVIWASASRLLFSVEQRRVPQGLRDSGPGLFAINVDGSGFRQLVERQDLLPASRLDVDRGISGVKATGAAPKGVGAAAAGQEGMGFKQIADAPNVQNLRAAESEGLQPWNTYLLGVSPVSADHVFAWRSQGVRNASIEVVQISTRTGRAKAIEVPRGATQVHLDSAGELRAATVYRDGELTVMWRDAPESPWRNLPGLMPEPDLDWGIKYINAKGDIYLSARRGTDKLALWSYEVSSSKWSASPLAKSPNFDVDASTIVSGGKVLGYRFTIDAEVTQWTDAAMQGLQQLIDKAMPRTVNRLTVPDNGAAPWVVVEAFSDTQPVIFLLFNRETRKFSRLGALRPDIDVKQMASVDLVRMKARDGLEIPVWTSYPVGDVKTKLPMVVMLHDGPFVNAQDWSWHPVTQFLAARGYLVLWPEFRGTKGLGTAHFRAGWAQLDTGIPSDVADVARWAIAQGMADPRRIAVVGQGFGGYAALLTLQREPGLFRCCATSGTLTDINTAFADGWTSGVAEIERYGREKLLGGRSDRSTAPADSGLQALRPEAIRQPLLMAHGSRDTRVPIETADAFHRKVKAGNAASEWVQYAGEGHAWRALPTLVDFHNRMAQFLDKHLAV